MKVDHDAFVQWAENKFDDVIVKGNEIQLNDPWWRGSEGLPDSDHKCWINTDKACFHAFKSRRTGSLYSFIMEIEGCSWDEAVQIAGGEESLYDLEKQLIEFLSKETNGVAKAAKPKLALPEHILPINMVPQPYQKWVMEYINQRKIKQDYLLFCIGGKYRNRIVIPYYDKNKNLIYFNTRALSDKEKVRYLGPPQKQYGVGKGDVLWMANWPKPGIKIYLTEGEFDAMSLHSCGFSAAACGGKTLSSKQIAMLEPYRIALSFDSDKAGDDVYKISQKLLKEGKATMGDKPRLTLVRPPKNYKDWNNFLVHRDEETIRKYIAKYEKPCNEDTLSKMQFGEL